MPKYLVIRNFNPDEIEETKRTYASYKDMCRFAGVKARNQTDWMKDVFLESCKSYKKLYEDTAVSLAKVVTNVALGGKDNGEIKD